MLGEAGIGKSRLIGEMTTAAHAAGVTVLRGRTGTVGPPVPYRPLAEALLSLARSGAPMPGYVGLVVFSPALVIALVFAVRQLLPGGAVVVDRLGVHFGDHHVAWAQVQDLAVEATPGWRSYHYVRLALRDGGTVDLPLMLTPSAHDQWLALRHLREDPASR